MAQHRNSPLTQEGRYRLCKRIEDGRPISHVAAEAGISRKTLGKWWGRYQAYGTAGLEDRSSRPASSPTKTHEGLEDHIESIRRAKKWGPARIASALELDGIDIAPATVHRILVRRGLNDLRTMDPPTGEDLRVVMRYEHDRPGDMIHIDIKKLGKIPDGGGWRIHGRDTEQARKTRRGPKLGYTYIHSAIDDHSRLAYSEALPDEKGVTAAQFWLRSALFFVEYGIDHCVRVLTDNGPCYRSQAFAEALASTGTKHRRTRPFTPKTNGKVERFNGTLSREWAYVTAYTSEAERTLALHAFLNYYNHERPHAALGHKPPVSRVAPGDYRIEQQPLFPPSPAPVVSPDQTSIYDFIEEPTS